MTQVTCDLPKSPAVKWTNGCLVVNRVTGQLGMYCSPDIIFVFADAVSVEYDDHNEAQRIWEIIPRDTVITLTQEGR